MSLGQAQQIYNLLQQINNMLSQIEVTAGQKLERVATQTIMVEQALQRSLRLFQRMGLPENVERAITFIQRMISITNQLQFAVLALNAAVAGTPGGWVLLSVSAAMIAMDVGDLMMLG